MLDPETIALVKATAPAVAQHAEAITRRFYTLMFDGNPEVKAYFNPAHQHSGGQQRALAGAICAYAANIDNLAALGPAVELIAHKHASLGIQAEHYPIVGKHLLVAIRDVLGEAATPEIIAAWGRAYGFLAEIFIQREGAIYKAQAEAPGGWVGYRPLTVARRVRESEIVTSFHLQPSDDRPLTPFLPGQYITVKRDEAATAVIRSTPRNYSLSDRPGLDHYRISVKREAAPHGACPMGLISNHLHDCVREGDTVLVGPPCGEFTLDPAQCGARPLVFLSGGIGITPLLAMLKAVLHAGVEAPVYFLHAARNSAVHAFREELRTLQAAHSNLQVSTCYDDPLPDDVASGRCDAVGLLTVPMLRELLPDSDADFYFCGPAPFMRGLHRGLEEWGVDPARMHYEFFGPKQDIHALSAV